MHPLAQFSIPDTLSFANLGGVNTQMCGLFATSSEIGDTFHKHLNDFFSITENRDFLQSKY